MRCRTVVVRRFEVVRGLSFAAVFEEEAGDDLDGELADGLVDLELTGVVACLLRAAALSVPEVASSRTVASIIVVRWLRI